MTSQPIDGSVYVTQCFPDEQAVYATIAGPDPDHPLIVRFDLPDLAALADAQQELIDGITRLASPW